jgi:YVTN family beta-propeller protein
MQTRVSIFGLIVAGALLLALGAAALSPLVRYARTFHPRSGKPILVPGQDGEATLLFNGWKISPAGRSIQTGDMLLGGAISPDGKTLAIANCGWNAHALHLVDIATEKVIARFPMSRSWNGIAWSPDGMRIYVSGGISNILSDVHIFQKNESGEWAPTKGFKLTGNDPEKTCIAGLTLSADGQRLFVLNNSDNHLYVLNTATGETRGKVEVGDHPIACKLSPDGKRLYVANWGGSHIAIVDVDEKSDLAVTRRLLTGEHPNDLLITSDERLFASCGNADAVYVFDTREGKLLEIIKTTLTPNAPFGSTPNALAVTPDNKTLYVANADNNNLCVVDISERGHSRVRGFIPTGWYPTAVHVSTDGKKIIVGSGKGTGTRPNPAPTPINPEYAVGFEYIGRQLNGLLSFVDTPNDAQLRQYTRQVYANTPYKDEQLTRAANRRKTAIPTKLGDPSPIKYVLYIIKENRTYDQVFGDLPQGNGDPNLCLFGRDVTPNHHALAEQFVLLDNLYCNGEVSADGHPWSTSAYATDFTQRSWVLSYSGKGRTLSSPTVNDPKAGYIWEACARKGITYRSYGEYALHKSLAGHVNLRWIGKAGTGGPPPGRDMDKVDIFIEEFKEFERTNSIPRFMIMSLGENHTNGTRPGSFTPKAMVASNDLALGKIVETITHSSVWKEFAIFVIEDDAQNGPDHVDSHRTVGLVISPYTRRRYVDSTMYTTASMLRTIELILGLPPLTQYDAAATPMFECFTDKPDLTPYKLQPARVDLYAKNPATAYGAAESAKMDWSEYDRIEEEKLNRILWHSIKGAHVPMPPPVRRALVAKDGRIHTVQSARKPNE